MEKFSKIRLAYHTRVLDKLEKLKREQYFIENETTSDNVEQSGVPNTTLHPENNPINNPNEDNNIVLTNNIKTAKI